MTELSTSFKSGLIRSHLTSREDGELDGNAKGVTAIWLTASSFLWKGKHAQLVQNQCKVPGSSDHNQTLVKKCRHKYHRINIYNHMKFQACKAARHKRKYGQGDLQTQLLVTKNGDGRNWLNSAQ